MPQLWRGRWRARVKIDQYSQYLGTYPTEALARRAEGRYREENCQLIEFVREDRSRRISEGMKPAMERRRRARVSATNNRVHGRPADLPQRTY